MLGFELVVSHFTPNQQQSEIYFFLATHFFSISKTFFINPIRSTTRFHQIGSWSFQNDAREQLHFVGWNFKLCGASVHDNGVGCKEKIAQWANKADSRCSPVLVAMFGKSILFTPLLCQCSVKSTNPCGSTWVISKVTLTTRIGLPANKQKVVQ